MADLNPEQLLRAAGATFSTARPRKPEPPPNGRRHAKADRHQPEPPQPEQDPWSEPHADSAAGATVTPAPLIQLRGGNLHIEATAGEAAIVAAGTPIFQRHTLAKLDGRTREARLLRDFRADLVRHVGGRPSATQAALITQACQLQLRIALMDRATVSEAVPSERNGREYLAWANALQRLLRQLGKGAAAAPRSLPDYLAAQQPAQAPPLPRLPRIGEPAP